MHAHSIQDPVYLAALERRFAKASRHSRWVRFLRKAVPAVLAAAVVVILGVSIFNPFRMLTGLPIDIGNVIVSGTKITMQAPHMAGFTPDRRPYEMTAKTAMQDIANPNHVELEMPKAKVEMEDKSIVTMDARRGFFKTREQLLDLFDDVILKSPTYEVRLSEASIDMGKGTVVSNKPVEIVTSDSVLNAQRLTITERGDLMKFEGGVRMVLKPADPPAPAATGR